MSINILNPITSGQCRAARALLDLTQPQLAALAEIGLSSVVDFERSRRDVSRPIVLGLKVTLENAGVQFIAKNSAGGAGVRLRN